MIHGAAVSFFLRIPSSPPSLAFLVGWTENSFVIFEMRTGERARLSSKLRCFYPGSQTRCATSKSADSHGYRDRAIIHFCLQTLLESAHLRVFIKICLFASGLFFTNMFSVKKKQNILFCIFTSPSDGSQICHAKPYIYKNRDRFSVHFTSLGTSCLCQVESPFAFSAALTS